MQFISNPEMRDFVQEKFRDAPILSAKMQRKLIIEYHATNDPAKKATLKEKLLSSLWRYAISEANKFSNIISDDTARQAAYTGLIKAIDKYKLKSGAAVTTCMYWWVRVELIRSIFMTRYQIHIPEGLYTKLRKLFIMKIKRGQPVSMEVVAKTLYGDNPSPLQMKKVNAFMQTRVYAGSLMNGICETTEYKSSFNDHDFAEATRRLDIERAIERCHKAHKIDDRQREALCMYHNLNGEGQYGYREIGERFNVTRERIRQILEKAYKVLRAELDAYSDGECYYYKNGVKYKL